MKPWQLEQAETLEALAQRYHCGPWELLEVDAHFLLQHLAVYSLGHREESAPGAPQTEDGSGELMELGGLAQVLDG